MGKKIKPNSLQKMGIVFLSIAIPLLIVPLPNKLLFIVVQAYWLIPIGAFFVIGGRAFASLFPAVFREEDR